MNITITRENAICMFLLVPYDPVVAHSFLMSMEQIGRLELCYKRDKPNEPMILSKLKICSDPITYLLYQPVRLSQGKYLFLILTLFP